jgi:phosphate-selective porin OprO and OprP
MYPGNVRRKWAAGLALAAIVITAPGALVAKEPSRSELEERIRRLEQIIRENGLDKPAAKRPVPAEAAAPPPLQQPEVEQIVDDKLKKQKVLAGWKDGFFLESPNGDFKLKFRGYAQVNARYPFSNGTDPTNAQFFLRRVRPIFEGTVYKYFDFKLMPDFGLGTTTLQDAYLDVNYFGPEIRLRTGKAKVPLNLERLQGGDKLVFIERSISNNLAPNRDVGLYLFGDVLGSTLGYQAGIFNGVFDGGQIDGDINQGKELAARLFASPFKNTDYGYLKGLGFGLAGTYGNNDNGSDITSTNYRTSERVTIFKYAAPKNRTVTGQGTRNHFDPQGYYFWGPFGFMAEYIRSQQGVEWIGTKSGAITDRTFINTGWYAQASYVLTGEDASYNGVVPINNFDPRNGRWGAFEVALRGSKLKIDEEAFTSGFADPALYPSQTSEITVGLNWYLNKNFRFQVNYANTHFDHRIEIGDELFSGVNSFQTEFQISY